MNKFYTSPTQYTTLLYPKTKNGKPIYFNTRLSDFMKKYYSIFILTFLVLFGGNSFAASVTHTFSAISGTIDSYINYTTQQNSSANAPAFNVNLRLYYNSGGNGCSITLTPTDAIITDVEIYGVTSYLPTVKYNVDGGGDATASLSSTTYTISSISASTSLKIRNANTSNTQLRITGIKVTYTPKYKVTYDANGSTTGTAPTDASSYVSGATVTVKANTGTLAKTGFTFSGWNTADDGTGTDYAASGSATLSMPSNDLILYAKWTATGTPTLSATALTAFGSQCTGGTYGPNSFTITGTSLTTANVTVAALSGYTYSTTSGGTYTTSLSLTQGGGAYSQDIYVKFSPVSATAYNGNIAVGGGGATSINVAASGTGTDGTPAVSTVTATAITTSTASSGGNTISTTCGTITAKGVVWALTANPTIASNLGITSDGTGTSNYTSSITGLSSNTLYHYRAYVTNSNGVTTYGSDLTFTTLKNEPTNYPTGFACGTTTTTTIPLNWTDATGASIPDGYLIKWSSTSYAAISAPSDGTAEADGATTKNVAQGSGTYTAIGLTSTTTYYFKIWSYTNSGTNINYKLVSEPQTSCVTQTPPPIIITEFAGKGYGGDFNNEYIELGNLGLTNINLSGWVLEYYNSSSLEATLNLSGTINANSAYVIAVRTTYTGAISPDFVPSSSFSMNSTGYVVLKQGATIIDEAGSSSDKFSDDKNYEFTDCPNNNKPTANWDDLGTGNGTPGILNCRCTPPTTQASAFGSSSITTTTAIVSWTRGNGDKVLVVAKEGSAVNADPVKGTSYTANAAFGSGSQIGTGNYVLYSGTGTSVNITGLTAGKKYYFAIYEYFDADKCYFDSELTGNLTTVAPTITLSSPNPAVAANNMTQGTDNNVIYRFDLAATDGNITFTNAVISTSGTYVAANITNVKLWYSSDATFNSGSDVLLATKSVTSTGNQTFPAFSRVINNSSTGYFFVTTDIPCSATAGNTMIVNAITTGNLTFTNATKTGTAYAGGTQTIIGATPINVTSPATSVCENGATTVSWTAPAGCSDNVFIFVKPTSAGAFTMTPTGNGISYTANTTYGSGTAFDGGFCVYKGTGTTVTVTGLTNGVNYTYKIFTRNGTTWSSGVITNCTPNIAYCTAASTNKANEFIEGVEFNTINNTSAATYYTDYTSSPTTVIKSETYPLSIYNGDYYASDVALVWIDWNGDGDFVDAGENVFASASGDPAPYYTNITIPATAITGTVRMRIRLYDSYYGTPNSTPCGTHTYGEVEDYALTIIEPCIPTHTVSTFTPTSGPVGTYVTINGTGFTASTTVSFGSVASTSVEFINSTKIIAVVPTGATTGKIKISESSCVIKTSSDFTLIKESGSCTAASSYGDLIISEVYDGDAYNVCYIELYNPNASDINLGTSKYSIKIDNNTGPSPISIDRTINLSGVIAAGSTFLINLGTSANTCNETWDLNAGGSGINEYDNIFLAKNGTDVDRVNTPSNTGYSMLRKSTATAPTTTYSSGDWTISNTESCADLGVAPVITHPNPIVVITNTDGCGLNLSVAVTEGNLSPSGDLTYK